MKLNRTDSIGVPPLKVESNVIDSNKEKANILNKHFQSVFTYEDTANIPNKGLLLFPEIGDIVFTTAGIEKQLRNQKPNNAVGPD